MFHITSDRVKPLYVTVSVNGNPLSMEIDTGASVSVVSRKTFETIRNGETMLELNKSTVRLQTYTGQPIEVCGTVTVSVTHNRHSAMLPLIVTSGTARTQLDTGSKT